MLLEPVIALSLILTSASSASAQLLTPVTDSSGPNECAPRSVSESFFRYRLRPDAPADFIEIEIQNFHEFFRRPAYAVVSPNERTPATHTREQILNNIGNNIRVRIPKSSCGFHESIKDVLSCNSTNQMVPGVNLVKDRSGRWVEDKNVLQLTAFALSQSVEDVDYPSGGRPSRIKRWNILVAVSFKSPSLGGTITEAEIAKSCTLK